MTSRPAAAARPFLAAPEPSRYFAAAGIEDARRRVSRCIERREGAALIIGAAGVGKSLLVEVLAEQFAGKMQVARLAGAQLCTRRALWQSLLFELDLPYRGMDDGELRLELQAHLAPRNGKPRSLLLLVDEAHALPARLLEELRTLTNISSGGVPLVSIVLAGGPALEERFAEPQLEAFSQRAATRCYLAPLDRSETIQYVRAQLAAAGADAAAMFAPDALGAIFDATDGLPRLINQLGDQLTWIAEETGMAPLDASVVQQAWAELQQLPTPWDGPSASPGGEPCDVLEFGVLGGDEYAADPEIDSAFERRGPLGHPAAGGTGDADDDEAVDVASIPFSAVRDQSDRSADVVAADLDAAENLLASFDATDARAEDPAGRDAAADPQPAPDPDPAMAVDPFAEPFDDEEMLIDPYADFESSLLAGAPRVANRLDAAFAAELPLAEPLLRLPSTASPSAACSIVCPADELVEDATELDELEELDEEGPLADEPASARIASSRDVPGELLVIDEDDHPAAEVVQARQFRRLFSCLESSAAGGM